MDLPVAGREFARITLTGLPTGVTPDAKVGDEDWVPMERVDGEWAVLVYGPDAPAGDGVPVSGTSIVRVRVTDHPEIVIRNTGQIRLV